MYYFIIFNKKGVVLYEEGEAPGFLNNLIQSINIHQLDGSKPVRDDTMEYSIRGQNVYLCINRTKMLESRINRFESLMNKLGENEMLTAAMIAEGEAIDKSSKCNDVQLKGKLSKTNESESLNFSSSKSSVSLIMDNLKKVNIKRAFNIFSNKIELKELKSKMNDHLIKKNVAPLFSEIITEDVISEIEEESVTEAVFKEKVVQSLGKILPVFDHDRFIKGIETHGGVYSICFVGVNGVGKSTSLAKIACWLIQRGLKVYIAACDTFRAGAIEQLKVHVERFKISGHEVGFYESGYSKDDASVAKAAISKAGKEGYDVILIDTAGRMHNKENLMQSLTKLIKLNNPDHILFVGEALVGGDSLDHIKEFNKRIAEGSSGRKIDSILLTKVDTVDDKIGQVLNLSFSASAPILFLGTGQSNSDLLPMNPYNIAELLLS